MVPQCPAGMSGTGTWHMSWEAHKKGELTRLSFFEWHYSCFIIETARKTPADHSRPRDTSAS